MLIRHIRLIHGLCSGKSLRLKCAQLRCCHVFGTFSGFRKHLNSKHAKEIEPEVEMDDIVYSDDVAINAPSQYFEVSASGSQVVPVSNVSIHDMCASAIAHLQVSGVGRSTLNYFVSNMEEVVLEVQSQAKDAALKCLASQNTGSKEKVELFKNLKILFPH